MGGIIDTLFGSSDDSAQKATTNLNAQMIAMMKENQALARQDALGLFPVADTNRNLGFQSALDVFGEGVGQAANVFQQGNVGAQETAVAGLGQQHNAILGQPVDLSGLQARALSFDPSFLNQTLPEFQTFQPAATVEEGGQQAALASLAALLGGGGAGGSLLQGDVRNEPGDQGAGNLANKSLSELIATSIALDPFSPFSNSFADMGVAAAVPGGILGIPAGLNATSLAQAMMAGGGIHNGGNTSGNSGGSNDFGGDGGTASSSGTGTGPGVGGF